MLLKPCKENEKFGMKAIINDMIFTIIFGATIGLTVGIADAFINTPFNLYLFLTVW